MRIAVADWDGIISPVFDTARRVRLVDTDAPPGGEERWAAFVGDDPVQRALRLAESGAEVLICGAISRPLEAMVVARGIRVVSRVCGPADEVVRAFSVHRMVPDEYLMPGCCRRGEGGGRRRMRRRCGLEERGA